MSSRQEQTNRIKGNTFKHDEQLLSKASQIILQTIPPAGNTIHLLVQIFLVLSDESLPYCLGQGQFLAWSFLPPICRLKTTSVRLERFSHQLFSARPPDLDPFSPELGSVSLKEIMLDSEKAE